VLQCVAVGLELASCYVGNTDVGQAAVPLTSHIDPPAPVNHSKIFKGPDNLPLGRWYLTGAYWYETFQPDHFGQAEMNDSTMLSNKTSTA